MVRGTHDHIGDVLDRPISVDFQTAPLQDVLDTLCRQCGPDLQINKRDLRDGKVDPRTPVTITITGQSMRTALPAVLDAVPRWRLAVSVHNGRLQLTTAEAVQDDLETVVYDVSDLVGADQDAMVKLIDSIQNNTSALWFQIDGIGGTLESPGLGILVVRQNQPAQDEVRAVLARQRAASQE